MLRSLSMSPRIHARKSTVVVVGLLVLSCMNCGGGTPGPTDPVRGGACTSMGCEDGLHVALSPDSGWPAGAYRFVIVADGQTTVCEGALPLRACEQGASLKCDRPGVMIGESGCALPAAQHGFSSLQLAAGPANVVATIERDGKELVRKSIAPAYRETHPNGPSCPPSCRQASDAIGVAF